MNFYYEGIDLVTRQSVHGEYDAVSEQGVVRWLEEQHIEALSVHLSEKKEKNGRAVRNSDLVLPLQELATLTEQGVTLIDSLKALSENDENPVLARGFLGIASEIEGGQSFSAALSESSLPFPKYVAHLISAGESAGQLTVALSNASQQLSYDESVREDLRGALTYPLVLISAGLIAMLIIFISVVPKFTHLLDSDGDLPMLAAFVLNAGRVANDSPWLLLAVGALFFVGSMLIFTNKAVRHALMNVVIEVPVFGPWLAEQDSARWASLCSSMLKARVNLLTALTLAADSCEYTRRRHRASQMIKDVQEGESFSDALKKARLIPATSLSLIASGDKTGQLADMLAAVAKLHDASCKRRMKQVLQLVEPLAILVVGALIGVMILGIVQAITASTDLAI